MYHLAAMQSIEAAIQATIAPTTNARYESMNHLLPSLSSIVQGLETGL